MRPTRFGATGRTGRPLVEWALGRGHDVTTFVRDRSNLDVRGERPAVVEGDAYAGNASRRTVAGADAVISVLGQTSAGPDDLLTVAGRNVLDAMERKGVDRFVTLVGAGVRVEGESVPLGGRIVGGLLKLISREALEDAKAHVEDVRSRDMERTVIRAPRLSEGEYTGEYRTGDLELGMESVSRADVADFALDVVENGRCVRELPKIGY